MSKGSISRMDAFKTRTITGKCKSSSISHYVTKNFSGISKK